LVPTIDSDAHVIETMETWSFMEERERRLMPMVVRQEEQADKRRNTLGRAMRDYWVVGTRIFNRDSNNAPDVPLESREMISVGARLKHMDEMQVDVQVLYPTLLLRPVADNAPLELALARSYNRWLAGIWRQAKGRLRWVAVPPLLSKDKVRAEMAFAKENGACGIFMRGLECELPLSDEHFHPLYEIAGELDLAICIHLGNGSFAVHDFYMRDQPFTKFKLPTIGAFHSLIMAGTPLKFPKVRWGVVEVSANWLPYIVNDLKLRFKRTGKRLAENVLAANNFYVACEVTDDFSTVLPVAGEDHLVIGTDYGHNDSSSEIEALRLLRDQPGVGPRVVDKILWDNPRTLYGLS
jgi:predicted TIM-barrel fold metal-dependent hydrolase